MPVHFRRSASYNSSQRLVKTRSLAEADFYTQLEVTPPCLLVKHMKTMERVTTIRILVVDDSAVLRDAVRHLLSDSDAIDICGEACNGYEAIEKALKLCPDVIVMDIGMPAMDGLEATRRLLRANSTAEVLMFTEHNSEHARDACLQAGARGYLSKAQAADLTEAIRTVASHATYAGSTSAGAHRVSAPPTRLA